MGGGGSEGERQEYRKLPFGPESRIVLLEYSMYVGASRPTGRAAEVDGRMASNPEVESVDSISR